MPHTATRVPGFDPVPYRGRTGRLFTDGLQIEVEVIDARRVYGRTDLYVAPVAGSGQRWVSLDRVGGIEHV